MFIDVATVQERLENHSALESQIFDDPADVAASAQLEMAYRAEGRTEELLQLLLTRAENVATDEERVAILRQAAEVCSSSGDDASALMILLTAFDVDQGNPEIADQLDQLAYRTGQWDDVLDAYLLAAARLDDRERAGDLWLRIACAHVMVTGDKEAHIAALEHVQSVTSGWAQAYLDLVEEHTRRHPDVVALLAQLCGRIGDTARQARCLNALILKEDVPAQKAALHGELGTVFLRDGDREAANWHLREALRLDSSRADCRAALVELNKQEGNLREAADMMRAEAFGGQNRSEAAYQAAQLYSELEENTQYFDLLSVAMNDDPNHVGAALPLAERYYRDERWSELSPLISLLVENYSDIPASEHIGFSELCRRGGECAMALSEWEVARDYYARALHEEPQDVNVLHAMADVTLQLGDVASCRRAIDMLLSIQGLSKVDRSRACRRMAEMAKQSGRAEEALPWAQEAWSCTPRDHEIGLLVAQLHEECEQFRDALKVRRELLYGASTEQTVALHTSMAGLLCWKLNDPIGAIDEYERALAAQPDNRAVMHSLAELFSAVEKWGDAVDVILQIADLEVSPVRRGKYYDAAGAILAEKLSSPKAVKCFNLALDCFFVDTEGQLPDHLIAGCMRPFHRIVDFLHRKENYQDLERNYRKMIQRLGKDDPQVVHLWQELGQLYQGKLNRTDDAIASYEVVSALDENSNHRRVLLNLYEQSENQLDKAIEERLKWVEEDPLRSEQYAALCELYVRNEEYDRAFCATRALVFLGKASESQKTYFYQNISSEMRWPRVPFSNRMWVALCHRDEDPRIRDIFALIADSLMIHNAVDEPSLLARDGHSHLHNELRDLVGGVAYAMGMPKIRITVDLELNADLLFVPTQHGPAFVVGRQLWQAPTVRARVHAAARILSFARPHAQLRRMANGLGHLDAMLWAAVRLVRPDLVAPPAIQAETESLRAILDSTLPPSRRVQLTHAVHQLASSGEPHDIQRWFLALECTAQRVALILSGDLQVAAEIANREGLGSEVIGDILAFSVSQIHGDIRRDLSVGL